MVLPGAALFAYNPFQENLDNVVYPILWSGSNITWNLNPSFGSNVHIAGISSLGTEVDQAFNVWTTTPLGSTSINTLSITRGPDTIPSKTDPDMNDCVNIVSFAPSSAVEFSTGTIAFTQLTIAVGTPPFDYDCTSAPLTRTSNVHAAIVDADMMFNPAEPFSTAAQTPADEFDLIATASHEFGHMLGLDHSGIAHTMMFPFGDFGVGQQRTLEVDDVVGAGFLYPAAAFGTMTGVISGTVTRGGTGLFAAHVVAVDKDTGEAVVDGLTFPDGSYVLDGVPPGTYNILTLPVSGVYEIDSFSGWPCGFASDPSDCSGIPQNPIDYTGTFH